MKPVNILRMVVTAIIIVLITAFSISPSIALAQATWSSDQLIEDNAGYVGYYPQVAISGSNAVAVWRQYDGSNHRIYSNYGSPPAPAPEPTPPSEVPVGGDVFQVNKVGLIAPWIVLAAAIITGGIILRRQKAHS